ncbi:MAG TPA: HAD hydrolase-like protein, partial [Solirubrobacterales bacterium]|nr:HAD hydrolase-like protein [Solirubrobacterales bacterium]
GALRAQPGTAVHVGDLRRTDVVGAAGLGMRTVRYRGLNDESEAEGGEEADFVLDSHHQLPDVVDLLDRD